MKQRVVIEDWPSKEKAIALINRLPGDETWEMEVKPYIEKRSLSQSALYWMWCDILAKRFSNDNKKYNKDDIHCVLRHKFLGYEDIKINNTEIPNQLRSTTDLDKEEMFHFMMEVDEWALSLGVELPTPQGSQHEKLKAKNK